jgi:hypothetical protein
MDLEIQLEDDELAFIESAAAKKGMTAEESARELLIKIVHQSPLPISSSTDQHQSQI